MKNANYSQTFVDIASLTEDPSGSNSYDGISIANLAIARTYNSRSLHNGIFGFGWCSDIETRIKVTPEGNLKVIYCGGGMEVEHFRQDFSANEVAAKTQEILALMREHLKENKGVGLFIGGFERDAWDSIEAEMLEDEDIRSYWASVFGVAGRPVEGETYITARSDESSIIYRADTYIMVDKEGNQFTFDKNGLLAGQAQRNGVRASIIRDKNGGIKRIERSDGTYLNFTLEGNGKVRSIERSDSLMSEYRYSNDGDLISNRNAWLKIYKFTYDDLHNLTMAEWPDKSYIKINYDKEKDWVTSFLDRDGCTEDYLYVLTPEDIKNKYTTSVEKWCKDIGLVARNTYTFSHARRATGDYYLRHVAAEISTIEEYTYRHIEYDPVFGLPLTIEVNGSKASFLYSSSGTLLERRQGKFLWDFSGSEKSLMPYAVIEKTLNENNEIVSSERLEKDPWQSMYTPSAPHLPSRLEKTKLSPLLIQYLDFRSKNNAIHAAQTLRAWDISLTMKRDGAGRTHILGLALTFGIDQVYASQLEAAEQALTLASDIAAEIKLKGPEYRALKWLAEVRLRQSKLEESAAFAQRAITLCLEVEGQDSQAVIPIYMILAKVREKQERYAEAFKALEKSEKSTIDSGEAVEQVRARIYTNVGLFEEAKNIFKRSSSTLKTALRQTSSMPLESVYTLGDILAFEGSPGRAADWVQHSISVGEFDPESISWLMVRQATYSIKARDYSDAIRSIERVLEGNSRTNVLPSLPKAIALKEKAVLYSLLGKQEEATSMMHESLRMATKAGAMRQQLDDITQALGILYRDNGDYKKALRLFDEVKKRRLAVYPPEHWLIGDVLYQISENHRMAGNYKLARRTLKESQTIIMASLGDSHAMTARGLLSQSITNLDEADIPHAIEKLQLALELAILSADQEYIWQAQWYMSVALRKQRMFGAAVFFSKQAVKTIQEMRFKLVNIESALQSSFLKTKQDVYRGTASLLIDQGRLAEAQNIIKMLKEEELAGFLYRAVRAGPSVNILLTPQEESWSNNYERIQDQLASMGIEQDLLRKKLKIGLSAAEQLRLQKLGEIMSIARKEFDIFIQDIQNEATRYNSERARVIGELGLTSLRAMQGTLRALGHGAVIITYVVSPDKLSILVTTPSVQIARVVVVDEKRLNQLVNDFRLSLQDLHSNPLPLARSLYDILIRPIARDLQAFDAKVLMVSLDGVLRYIPLGALHDGDKYLISHYSIVNYTQAARDKLKDLPMQKWAVAGLGLTREVPGFNALPGVKKELESIVKNGSSGVLPGNIYLDEAFTKQQVKNSLALEIPVIHIASHFVFAPGNELASFVLLGDGTKLSLDELRYNFDFSHVELLTLSACETAIGGGKNELGQEIEGFGVLAQTEGAKAVIATLWSVSDNSTALFMQKFYELKRHDINITKAEAIRLSQLSLLEPNESLVLDQSPRLKRGGIIQKSTITSDIEKHKHPYYWAPFILMGNWL